MIVHEEHHLKSLPRISAMTPFSDCREASTQIWGWDSQEAVVAGQS